MFGINLAKIRIIVGNSMVKKIIMSMVLVSLASYSCEPKKDLSAADMPRISCTEITPEAFGVSGTENYIIALRNFAQMLLMQHRYLESALRNGRITDGYRMLSYHSKVGLISRTALLDRSTHAQEIKEALRTGKDHELLVRTPADDYLFAETVDGIGLLLKYRALFMQDQIDLKYKPLIEKIHQDGIQKNNMELCVIAERLRMRLERTQWEKEMKILADQFSEAQSAAALSKRCFEGYKLSDQLLKSMQVTGSIVARLLGLAFQASKAPTATSAEAKKKLIQLYESSQLPLYELIRKRLQELLIGIAKKDRKILVYSKTEQGELLPTKLDSFDSHEADVAKSTSKVVKSVDLVEQLKAKEAAAKEDQKKTKQKHKKQKHDLCIPQDSCAISAESVDVSKKQAVVDSSAPQAAATKAIDRQIPLSIVQTSKEATTARSAQKIPAQLKDEAKACASDAAAAADSSDMSYVIPDYTDGKIVSEDEEANVIIDDPCNKMRLFLFATKVEKRFVAPSLHYASNVLQWFKSAEKALEQQGYYDPANEKFAKTTLEQFDKVRIHRFSRLVDRYIATRGIVGKLPSRIQGHDEVIAVAIPGYIECYESGEKRPCLFAYLIDKVTHVCFHRNIEFRIGQKLIADFFNKGSFEVEFPSFDWRRSSGIS